MNYSLFGRRGFQQSRCNCFPRQFQMNQNVNNTRQSDTPKEVRDCRLESPKCQDNNLIIKHAAFGGVVLPKAPEKRATFIVASLNLDTSGYERVLVQLAFSCNIVINELKVRLRFQLFKQEKNQCFPVPVSTGILFYRDRVCTEANSFTLTAFDCDLAGSTYCCYSACAEIEDFENEGNLIISNPVLTAVISRND